MIPIVPGRGGGENGSVCPYEAGQREGAGGLGVYNKGFWLSSLLRTPPSVLASGKAKFAHLCCAHLPTPGQHLVVGRQNEVISVGDFGWGLCKCPLIAE